MLLGQFGSQHRGFLDSTTGVISPGPSHVTLLIHDNRMTINNLSLTSTTTSSNNHHNNHHNNHNNNHNNNNHNNTTNHHNDNNHHEPAGVGGKENG